MSLPTISVITPTYNRSNVLKHAIQSVLQQTFQDFEYFIINDGSTDDTEDVIKGFDDVRIRHVKLLKNSGNQCVPNNCALQQVRGKYIAYLGHDDIWDTSHLEAMLATIEGQDIAYSVSVLYSRRIILTGITEDWAYKDLMVLPISSVMHTADLIDKIGPWMERIEQWNLNKQYLPPDLDLLWRARISGASIVPTGVLTVFKWPSNRHSYAKRPVQEQEEVLEKVAVDETFAAQEFFRILTMHYSRSRLGQRFGEFRFDEPGNGTSAWRRSTPSGSRNQ